MSSQHPEDSNQLLQCLLSMTTRFPIIPFDGILLVALVVSAFQSYLQQNVEYPLAALAVQVSFATVLQANNAQLAQYLYPNLLK